MRTTMPSARPDSLSVDLCLDLIRDAIALVASGGAPRVVIAGLGSGDLLLDPARRLALEAGVRARPVLRPDGQGTDIEVERIQE